MAKTYNITIQCAVAEVGRSGDRSMVSADLQDVNVEHILDDIDNEDIIEWCQKNLEVEDIFSESDLEKWAEANGYVKATDNE